MYQAAWSLAPRPARPYTEAPPYWAVARPSGWCRLGFDPVVAAAISGNNAWPKRSPAGGLVPE
uniref:Uncharacterized protein n=1 Tax=Arundo donax TaxID=35708 RepID=A0A0A8Z811_ARUDO